MPDVHDSMGELCMECGNGVFGNETSHPEVNDIADGNVVCSSCGYQKERYESIQPVPNIPIEELLAQYEAECCDFRNMNWVAKVSMRYVQTMEDCQVRCLLYALARDYDERIGIKYD